jgi:hypothetical protein
MKIVLKAKVYFDHLEAVVGLRGFYKVMSDKVCEPVHNSKSNFVVFLTNFPGVLINFASFITLWPACQ